MSPYNEPYRPQFHFSPPKNWINDPNGLVYVNGLYHLYYQYNPHGDVWGDIHWAHASSRDLIHWQHEPIAIAPHPQWGLPFSGCAVVDHRNTSGLQSGEQPVLIALFTHAGEAQVQSLAYSHDGGQTWQDYAANPVIPNPGMADFRDPKVIWHEASQHWVMALAAGDHIQLYRSGNLREWTKLQDIGSGQWTGFGVWEMPDLFPLRLPDGTEKWVLLVGIGDHAPNAGSGTFYLLGGFDGLRFTPDAGSEPLWFEYGPDNYALQTWSNAPSGRRVALAWMSNWRYARTIPTQPWRGAMTLPRELALLETPVGVRLASVPAPEVAALTLPVFSLRGDGAEQVLPELCRLQVSVDVQSAVNASMQIRLESAAGDYLQLSYQNGERRIHCTRHSVADVPFPDLFTTELFADLPLPMEMFEVDILLDRGAVEVFIAGGLAVLTALVFPSVPLTCATLRQG